MIRFRSPRLDEQKSGQLCIELTDKGTWESFPRFAEVLAQQIGASVVERIEAPDIHLWKLSYAGHILLLVYDDYPNGVTIEPSTSGQDAVIQALFSTFASEASESGV